MNQPEKRRPTVERIAGLSAKSSYRDIRDGIGGGGRSFGGIDDQDIAAALGLVQLSAGKLPVLTLETYYGSSLLHEHKLRAAWAEHSEQPTDPIDARIRNRIAAALAIREFAGAPTPDSLLEEWGTLTVQNAENVRRNVRAVLSWLESHRSHGYSRFKAAMADVQETKRQEEAKKRAKV